MSKKSKTSVARAMELFCGTKIKDLPPLAWEFCEYMCQKYAGCGEVMLTAYAAYAECIEGYPCEDEAYKASPEAIKWFKEHQ